MEFSISISDIYLQHSNDLKAQIIIYLTGIQFKNNIDCCRQSSRVINPISLIYFDFNSIVRNIFEIKWKPW